MHNEIKAAKRWLYRELCSAMLRRTEMTGYRLVTQMYRRARLCYPFRPDHFNETLGLLALLLNYVTF